MNQPDPYTPQPEQPKFYSDFRLWAKDTAERVISTFIQVLIPFFIVGVQAGMGPWKPIVAALFPPIGTVVLASIPFLTPTITVWYLDVLFRLVRTVLVTGLGAALADNFDLFQTSDWRGVLSVVVTAALVFAKAEWARQRERTITPASLALAA